MSNDLQAAVATAHAMLRGASKVSLSECHPMGPDPQGYDPEEEQCPDCPDKFTCLPLSVDQGMGAATKIEDDPEVAGVLDGVVPMQKVLERLRQRAAYRERNMEIPEEIKHTTPMQQVAASAESDLDGDDDDDGDEDEIDDEDNEEADAAEIDNSTGGAAIGAGASHDEDTEQSADLGTTDTAVESEPPMTKVIKKKLKRPSVAPKAHKEVKAKPEKAAKAKPAAKAKAEKPEKAAKPKPEKSAKAKPEKAAKPAKAAKAGSGKAAAAEKPAKAGKPGKPAKPAKGSKKPKAEVPAPEAPDASDIMDKVVKNLGGHWQKKAPLYKKRPEPASLAFGKMEAQLRGGDADSRSGVKIAQPIELEIGMTLVRKKRDGRLIGVRFEPHGFHVLNCSEMYSSLSSAVQNFEQRQVSGNDYFNFAKRENVYLFSKHGKVLAQSGITSGSDEE